MAFADLPLDLRATELKNILHEKEKGRFSLKGMQKEERVKKLVSEMVTSWREG